MQKPQEAEKNAVSAPSLYGPRIQLRMLYGTPVFASPDRRFELGLKRVYGFQVHKATGLFLFPAMYPFGMYVVKDLDIVFGDGVTYEEKAQGQVELLEQTHAELQAAEGAPLAQLVEEMVPGFEWVTSPFEHQAESVLMMLTHPRYGLFLDCGLGKTKAALDGFRALKAREPDSKMLVLCPGHLPIVWQRQAAEHSGDTLNVVTLTGETNRTLPVKKRHARIRGSRDPDVFPGSTFLEECPDVRYEELPADAPVALRELELEYVRAVQADDAVTAKKLRKQILEEAKAAGFRDQLGSVARKLDPLAPPLSEADILVLPYSLVRTDSVDLALIEAHFPYNIVCCDESHMLRSPRSLRTKGLLKLSQKVPRRYILSGTPALGDPMHLYGQLTFLGSFITGSWWHYRRRHVVTRDMGAFQSAVGFKNLDVLNEIVSSVALRKKAADCLDLPELRILTRDVFPDEAMREMYNEFVEKSVGRIYDRAIRPAHAADLLQKLIQVLAGFVYDPNVRYDLCDLCPNAFTCEAKEIKPYTPECSVIQERPPRTVVRLPTSPRLDALEGLLTEILENPENKVIVWCTYTEEIDMLVERLEGFRRDPGPDDSSSGAPWRKGRDFVVVAGGTDDTIRAQDTFNDQPECRVYIGQVATGIGVTLNSANFVVYYGVTWSLDHFEQSLARCYRAGQTRKVTVYLLKTPGSIHETIFKAIEDKQDISRTLTDRIRCGLCANSDRCNAEGVLPFEEGCVYSDNATRVTARPKKL